jgi:phosphate/sulfate permease
MNRIILINTLGAVLAGSVLIAFIVAGEWVLASILGSMIAYVVYRSIKKRLDYKRSQNG